ncbi:MAG: hypothetical protein ACOYBL_12165 [Lachnospiraceae bacterium]|jgi:predicted nuclease with TOPRIM domain
MIVNYNTDTGKLQIPMNKSSKSQIITKDVAKALDKLKNQNISMIETSEELGNVLGYSSDEFFKFAKAADTSGDLISQYKNHMKQAGKETTSFGKGLKSVAGTVGSFALNMGANMLISAGVNALVTAIDNYIHRNEIAVEKGEEAQKAISSAYSKYEGATSTITDLSGQFTDNADEINQTSDAIDGLANKYAELKKGVNTITNENVSLGTDEYQNYLDISNQLASLSPALVSGYDRQGNAILNLSSNASSAASALQEAYDMQRQIAHGEISQNINDTFAGAAAEVEIYSDKNQELQDELNIINEKLEKPKKNQEKIHNQIDDLKTKGSITFDSKDFENSEAIYEDYMKLFRNFVLFCYSL